jgi:hypothetical protein
MSNIVTYIIGENRLVWERVREEDNAIINPSSAVASLINASTNMSVTSLTVTKSAGLVQAIIPSGQITIPGNYYIDWDITYAKIASTATKTIITDIIATYRDTTYLMTLVPRMRVWINDDPSDPNRRIKNDSQLKKYLAESVRHYITGYTMVTTLGIEDISAEPVAESDTEQLIILYGSYIYLGMGIEAIAREQTAMFSVDYDSAYRQIKDRMTLIWDRIVQLDDNAVMPILSESDVEMWGKIGERYVDALETWNTDND